MTYSPRPAGRGSRSARKAFEMERRGDQLKRDGALTNEIEAANRAQAEAIQCPICGKPVHPSNFAKHNRSNHPEGKPLHEHTERLPLAAIRVDGGTQPRAATNEDTIAEYAEAMQEGAEFPALVAFYDGTDYWLADGFHRFYAAQLIGWQDFPADVRQGTQRDAILYSVGANSTHGLRRTNADKRRGVERLLRDDEWGKWSDREIARLCGVGHAFVSNLRKEFSLSTKDSETRTYTTKHGTPATMNTSNIGSKPQMTPPASEPVRYVPVRDDVPADEAADDYVPEVPEMEEAAPSPSNGEGHFDEPALQVGNELWRVGTEVLTPAGHSGKVVDFNGRLVKVQTVNGVREYDVAHLRRLYGEKSAEAATPTGESIEAYVEQTYEFTSPEVKAQIIAGHYQRQAANGAPAQPPAALNYKLDNKRTFPQDETVSQPFDRCQTPPYALTPLLPCLPKTATIWEAAAGEHNLVHTLSDAGYQIVHSDILDGQNFFDYQPKHWDMLITNPPYSLKLKWVERCYQLNKPFALLIPLEVLGTKAMFDLTQQYGFEMMLLDARVDFKMPNRGWDGSSPFPVIWFCWHVLPQQVMYGSIAEGKKAFNEHL